MNGPDEYDQLVARDFKEYSPQHLQIYKTISALLTNRPAKILEIGTGVGYGYKMLKESNCIKDDCYFGVEPSSKCVDYVFKKYGNIICPDGWMESDMKNYIFDFSLCIEVIEHIQDIDMVEWFKKMQRHTEVASFVSTPDKNTDAHGVFTKDEVQSAMYAAGYRHVVKIEWQKPHTLFIGEI